MDEGTEQITEGIEIDSRYFLEVMQEELAAAHRQILWREALIRQQRAEIDRLRDMTDFLAGKLNSEVAESGSEKDQKVRGERDQSPRGSERIDPVGEGVGTPPASS